MNQLAGHAEAGQFSAESVDHPQSTASPAPKPAFAWLKKLGFLGFMFFLLKGLLWLAIPAILANRLAD